jgi:hypothetical protein
MDDFQQHQENDAHIENFGDEDGSLPELAVNPDFLPDDDSPPHRTLVRLEQVRFARSTLKVTLVGFFALAALVVVFDPSMVEPVWERTADLVGLVLAAVVGYYFRGSP